MKSTKGNINTKKNVSEKGITLLALVITIIILLILAGISITMLTGKEGLLNKVEKARNTTRGSQVKEQVEMWKMEKDIAKNDDGKLTKSEDEMLKDLEENKLLRSEERKELEEERSVKIGGIVTTLDNIGNVYAKLYSSSDGDVLELSSDENYVDKTEGLTLKQDYGNIANNHYNSEINYVQEYDEENNFYTVIVEEIGFFPPWIEKIENEYSAESYYYKESYYDMNYTIKKAKIVDDIELTFNELIKNKTWVVGIHK